jgi:hypothetical protein
MNKIKEKNKSVLANNFYNYKPSNNPTNTNLKKNSFLE